MTEDRRLKKAIRALQAQTGKPYNVCRRIILADRAKNQAEREGK